MESTAPPDPNAPDNYEPTWYIGHHDTSRTTVTSELLLQAQDCNYDMLTTPITTPHFHARILALVANHLYASASRSDQHIPSPSIPALSPADTHLVPGPNIPQLLGVISPWIDLCTPDPFVYKLSKHILEMEVAYAAFCGIGNLILPTPKLRHGNLHGDGIIQYAYAVQEALSLANYISFSVSLPMTTTPQEPIDEADSSLAQFTREDYMDNEDGNEAELATKHDAYGTWDAWNVIRTICKYHVRLFVALIIPRYLRLNSVRHRWSSEPLRVIILHGRTFVPNEKGFLVLHKAHKELISQYMRMKNAPWILCTGFDPIPGVQDPETWASAADGNITHHKAAESILSSPTPAEANETRQVKKTAPQDEEPLARLNYLRWLQRHQSPRTTVERFGAGYQDYLQAPLQPLTDNLESITYEVFEKDPVKYDLYGRAIAQALKDWRQQGNPASGPGGRIVVAVVGAGRGPLVSKALQASHSTQTPIDIWALEKNPNAFVLLQRHNAEAWNNQVTLVKSDMRSWKGPVRSTNVHNPPYNQVTAGAPSNNQIPASDQNKSDTTKPPTTNTSAPKHTHYPIDILISELLGSFADNELSPECLDGITPLLNKTHGISIPHSYTAYLTPIAAPKLHADISARGTADPNAANTPYVVMLHAIDYLSTNPTSSSTHPSRPSTEPSATRPSTTESSHNRLPAPAPNVLPVWTFTHGPSEPLPVDSVNAHNERHARLSFELSDRGVCHGLAGYFEAVLYDPGDNDWGEKIELSTSPLTMEGKSQGMMSWFPIFFPLKTPLYTPDSATLTVSIYRATDNRKVWYEWMVEAFANLTPASSSSESFSMGAGGSFGVGGIGEGGSFGGGGGGRGRGKRVRVGVSEVGSSRGAGCLM